MPVSLGKKFEEHFSTQLEDAAICFDRFKDDTAGYKGIRNICDFSVFFNGYLFYIECKSIHGKTFNYANLTDNQYTGLLDKCEYDKVIAGVLIWFIDCDVTVFVPITVIKQHKELLNYKSFKSYEIPDMCTIFEGKKLRKFFKYDIDKNLSTIIRKANQYGS